METQSHFNLSLEWNRTMWRFVCNLKRYTFLDFYVRVNCRWLNAVLCWNQRMGFWQWKMLVAVRLKQMQSASTGRDQLAFFSLQKVVGFLGACCRWYFLCMRYIAVQQLTIAVFHETYIIIWYLNVINHVTKNFQRLHRLQQRVVLMLSF